ncbi:hypothetical protein FO519_000187 [Halicephalobus sp. NKZ332]|nr:hypothetical protein FO519_000187 [Halicephalobus sp. NKZ332]
MSKIRKLTSAYANAAYVSEETPEFRLKSIRRPPERNLRLSFKDQLTQQKLSAWEPSFHTVKFLAFIHIFGIILVILGFVMLREINRVLDFEKNLSCKINVTDTENEWIDVCHINITRDIPHPVMFSYKWDVVMQSHRLFPGHINKLLRGNYIFTTKHFIVDSEIQESEEALTIEAVEFQECLSKEPYINFIGLRDLKKELPACGAGLNSNMEDAFELYNEKNETVPMTSEDITFELKNILKHPFDADDSVTVSKWKEKMAKCDGVVNSSCWPKKFYDLDEDIHNNGIENIDYFIWQNKAAFPSFRKPYRKLQRNNLQYKDGLPQGIYKLKANMKSATNFDFRKAKQEKKDFSKEFMITVPSWLGMRNPIFAYLYIVVGSCSVLSGLILTYIHIKFGKTLEQKCSDSMPLVFHG